MNNPFTVLLADDASQSTILPLFGGAKKPIEAMSEVEQEKAAEQVYLKVREAAFSRGLPVIVEKEGQTIREFADGHTELIA